MKTMKRIVGMVSVAVTLVSAPAWTQQAAAPAATAPPATAPPAAAPVASYPKVAAALEVVRVWRDAQRAYEQIPGLAPAIVLDEDPLWIGGIGQADLAAGRAATADTIYSICSQSSRL